MNSIAYKDLEKLVEKSTSPSIHKVFKTMTRKLQTGYQKQFQSEIKYLKFLIKQVKEDKDVDLSMILGASEMTKTEKIETLTEILKEYSESNIPSDLMLLIADLPKSLQKVLPNQLPPPQNISTEELLTVNPIKKLRQEQLKEQNVRAKEITSIEPLIFFTMYPFYALEKLPSNDNEILKEILNLNDNLLPKKYTLFENFNTIIEKKHLTGEYFEYNIKQSNTSKKFLEIEPALRNVLFDFTTLDKNAIKKAREEMRELNLVLQILYDFQPNDYSHIAPIFIKNIIRIYQNLIERGKNDKLTQYLVRSIQVLEHRRKKLHKELPQLIKDDDKRKFLTREIANIVDTNTTIQQTVQIEDAQIGDEHFNERFETEDFDDIDMVLEEDSELLG